MEINFFGIEEQAEKENETFQKRGGNLSIIGDTGKE